MRKVTIILISCLIAVFLGTGFLISFAQPPIEKKPKMPPKPIPIPPQKPCEGPDPAVISLNVTKSVTVRNGIKIGVLSITSTLKNVGTKDFISRAGQQGFTIQAKNPAISGPRAYETLASKDFSRLNKDESINLSASYEISRFIEWGHRPPNPGECQAERIILSFVSYDPDIYMDGNPNNDDCDQRNNQKRYTIKYMVECPW